MAKIPPGPASQVAGLNYTMPIKDTLAQAHDWIRNDNPGVAMLPFETMDLTFPGIRISDRKGGLTS